MESKKKKKVILTISLVSIFLICAIIGTFFVVRKINNKNSNPNNATNVSMNTNDKLFKAPVDIIEQKIPQNYNGNFKFKYVSSLTFNKDLTTEQIKKICESKGSKDPNGLLSAIRTNKLNDSKDNNELIVLKNGLYTRSYNNSQIVEKGRYFGNDDLAEISLLNNNEYKPTYEMSLTCIKGEMISSEIVESLNPGQTLLFIYKNFYSNEDKKLVLFTVTYVYEMLEDTTLVIPDSKLDFDI